VNVFAPDGIASRGVAASLSDEDVAVNIVEYNGGPGKIARTGNSHPDYDIICGNGGIRQRKIVPCSNFSENINGALRKVNVP
jgi:hypothetical protein